MTVTYPLYLWEPVESINQNDYGKRRFALTSSVSISYGQVLYLTDGRTASGANLGTAPICGVAAEEILQSDNKTDIAVFTDGIFRAKASGAIGVGNYVAIDSRTNNTLIKLPEAVGSGAITVSDISNVVGRVYDIASADEEITIRLGPL